MTITDILSIFDFGGLMGEWGPTTIAIVLSISILLFLAAISICAIAFRAARAAVSSQHATEEMLAKINGIAIETQQYAARAENASLRDAEIAGDASLSDRLSSVRVDRGDLEESVDAEDDASPISISAANSNAEVDADVEVKDGDEIGPAPGEIETDFADDNNANERLKTAARAASEPSALLRHIMRRR